MSSRWDLLLRTKWKKWDRYSRVSMRRCNNDRRFSMLICVLPRRFRPITTLISNPTGLNSVRSSLLLFLLGMIVCRFLFQWWGFGCHDHRSASKSRLSKTLVPPSDNTDESVDVTSHSRLKHSVESWPTIQHEHTWGSDVCGNTLCSSDDWKSDSIRFQCSDSSSGNVEWNGKHFPSSSYWKIERGVLLYSRSLDDTRTVGFVWRGEHESLPIDLADFSRWRRKWTSTFHPSGSTSGASHSSWSHIDYSTDVSSECHRSLCFAASTTVQSALRRSERDVGHFCSLGIPSSVDQSLLSVDLQIRCFARVEHVSATDRWLDPLLSSK